MDENTAAPSTADALSVPSGPNGSSRALLDQLLHKHGITSAVHGASRPEAETPAALPLAQTDPVADVMEASFWDESAHPGRYSFNQPPPGFQHSPQQELQVRQLFAEEKLPPEIGRHITTLWNRALLSPPSHKDNLAAMQRVTADISRHDPVRGAETIRLAQAEIQAIAKRNPAVLDMLEQSGLGNDRWLIEHLANRARARANRGK